MQIWFFLDYVANGYKKYFLFDVECDSYVLYKVFKLYNVVEH